jgi:hypothetical protein
VVSVTPRPCFIPGKGPPVPIVQEAGWAPVPVWTQRLEKKSFRLCRGSNLNRPFVQPVARHYTNWATRLTSLINAKYKNAVGARAWRGPEGKLLHLHPLCAALALRYVLKTEIICNFFLLGLNMTAGLFLVQSYSKLNRKMAALLDIAPYILVEVDLRFRGINCLYDQSDETSIYCGLLHFSTKWQFPGFSTSEGCDKRLSTVALETGERPEIMPLHSVYTACITHKRTMLRRFQPKLTSKPSLYCLRWFSFVKP